MRFAGLIVHDPQRTVRQAVDPVGQAPEDHTQGFSGAFERKLLPDPLLESFDRKIVMRGVVRQYAAPNIADYNIFDQQQITAIILNRRFNILQIVFIDGRNYRLLHFGRTGQRTQRLSAAGLPDKGAQSRCKAAWRIVPNIGASTSSEISSSGSNRATE